MERNQRRLPVWLLGLCNFTLGAYFAVMLLTTPQLLAANDVPEARIASVTTIGLIPTFCSFLLAPLLDWRLRRRTYAVLFAGVASMALCAELISINSLGRMAVFMFIGSAAVNLYQAAIGGWFGSLVNSGEKDRLGAWFVVGNVAGGGLIASIAIVLLRRLPFNIGAVLLGGVLLVPLALFPWIPCPAPDRRLASESFREFFRDVLALLRKRSVLLTLLMFALPAASFALTNTLTGLGQDFAASETSVAFASGIGVTVAGVVGSLLVPKVVRRLSPRWLYVLVGTAGAAFTLVLVGIPHTPSTFAVAIVGENVFQAAAFAVEATIVLATIGAENPLAATQFGLLIAAPNLPITYMQAIDGAAYAVGGLAGTLLADAGISLVACVVVGTVFWRLIPKGDQQVAAQVALE